MTSREEILRRVRDGLKALPDDERTVTVPRNYRRHAPDVSPDDRTAIVELFVERLRLYGAQVNRTTESEIPDMVRTVLRTHDATSVVAPDGLPEDWLRPWAETDEHRVIDDHPQLSTDDLDGVDAVVTACAGAVADSGTVVLDGGPGQGRRGPTLVLDCHVCVVRADQIVSALPEILDRLDPRRPITFFSGPAATVDIEMVHVEGVHGPRQLEVVVVE
ncbi:LUD domain-containing protein [Nocardia sp. BMG51109]|uniref:LutC/YkgG family protein n=1 Tax=Nocardia sp. BMG51109 TaxID=1056816 RepID=UPI0004660087|nr:LUD domain-containing protein [Nocardia sp. BMG51109]